MHVAYNENMEGDDMVVIWPKQLYYNSDLIFMTDDKVGYNSLMFS